MAQVEFRLDILGAGRLLLPGQVPHDTPLGRGQLHLSQRRRHRLGHGAVENTNHMAVVEQSITPKIKCRKLRNSVAYDVNYFKSCEKSLQFPSGAMITISLRMFRFP